MINDRIKDFTYMPARDQIAELATLVDQLCIANRMQAKAIQGMNTNMSLLAATQASLSKRIPSLTDEQVALIAEDKETRELLETDEAPVEDPSCIDDTEIQTDGDDIDNAQLDAFTNVTDEDDNGVEEPTTAVEVADGLDKIVNIKPGRGIDWVENVGQNETDSAQDDDMASKDVNNLNCPLCKINLQNVKNQALFFCENCAVEFTLEQLQIAALETNGNENDSMASDSIDEE